MAMKLTSFIIIVLLSGCATDPYNNYSSSYRISASPTTNVENITLSIRPEYDREVLEEQFHSDLIGLNLFPVNIKIANYRNDPVKISTQDIMIIFSDKTKLSALQASSFIPGQNLAYSIDASDISSDIDKRDNCSLVAGLIIPFGVIIAPIACGIITWHTIMDIEEIKKKALITIHAINEKALKDSTITVGATVDGFVFFPFKTQWISEPKKITVKIFPSQGYPVEIEAPLIVNRLNFEN
jgi:hypothetical protein